MGVVSRKVFPLCGKLCFFCPSLRARSRQPVKRYKKLLSDIFLRSQVPETTHQFGRFLVSTTPDIPFKEMASHCEALMMGKQNKMYVFMNAQQRQEIMLIDFSQDQMEEKPTPYMGINPFQKSYNPFVEPDCSTYQQTQYQGSSSSYSNNLQYQPQFLHLPASSPFDNFLKAAGC